jgi:hypothetical protein
MSKRLQIGISGEGFERLKRLKEKTDSSSYADVTSKAYRLYEYFLTALEEDKKVMTVDVNGVQTEIRLL